MDGWIFAWAQSKMVCKYSKQNNPQEVQVYFQACDWSIEQA